MRLLLLILALALTGCDAVVITLGGFAEGSWIVQSEPPRHAPRWPYDATAPQTQPAQRHDKRSRP